MAPKLAFAPQVSAAVSMVWYLSRCQCSSAVLEVVHGGRRCGDEHIIPQISLLTMPIYFDNQLTVVPVQPPVGQWFIRIDQFWVASCAAVWGQTQAWLAVQSGVLSNARPWLTAHQHAELNSLAKCFPFSPVSRSYTTMNACLRWNKSLACSFAHSLVTFLHSHNQTVERKVDYIPDTLDDTGNRRRRIAHIHLKTLKLWITFHYIKQHMLRRQWRQLHSTSTANAHHAALDDRHARQQRGGGKEPEVEEGGCRQGSANRVIISVF